MKSISARQSLPLALPPLSPRKARSPWLYPRGLPEEFGSLLVRDIRVELELDERELLKGHNGPYERRPAIDAEVPLSVKERVHGRAPVTDGL